MKKILTAKPSITDREINYVNDAIRNGWGEKCYDYIKKFEKSFADYLGVKYAITTSSCTVAIHVAMTALGVKQGDEVIIPDITWIACATPAIFQQATPVFVDVLEDTWCINPESVKKAITSKTKAILPVHVYGSVCEMDEILAIGKEYGIPIIEDAAEALGSEYKGKKTGSMGSAGAFSFHGTKTLSTGEGGMFVTNDDDVYEKASKLCNQGRDPKSDKTFWMSEIGYKTKISNLQAAMGCAQIERADDLVDRKREIFNSYKKHLGDREGIKLNVEQEYVKNSFWHPTVIFDEQLKIDRDELIQFLNTKEIGSRPFFYPVSSLPMFENKPGNIVAYSLYSRGINLPSYYELTEDDIQCVSEAILEYLEK